MVVLPKTELTEYVERVAVGRIVKETLASIVAQLTKPVVHAQQPDPCLDPPT